MSARGSLNFLSKAVLILTLSISAHAQSTSSLSGRVVDSHGAVVRAARITAMHLASTTIRVAETDEQGNYLIPSLPIGGYTLEAQSNGFQSQRVEGLNVELGRTIVQDFRLNPGGIADVVTVTSDSLLLWSQYRGRIVGAMVIVVQALLIAGLLFERSMRWRANQQLAESEQQFSKAFKANPQPMSITTLNEGRYLDVNESFLRMSGGTRVEVIGHTSSELNNFEAPEDRQRLLVEPLLKYGGVRNFELKFRRKDGSFRTLLSSAELIELNKQKCILVASSDITERKESEHRLAELTGRLLRTQDEERRHIARELHDVTAQSLGLILLNLAQVQGVAVTMDKKSKDQLAESVALGEQALKEIRTLSYVLHPPLLDQAGLVTALKWYVKGFSERSGVKVEFTEQGNNGHRMPPDVEYALFRVVQECLTNIRRHTNSETADISVTRTVKEVLLIIQDRGKAHHLDLPRNGDGIESIGVGIAGMRHRLKQLGGELSVETDASGTTVTATVPVRWVYDSSSTS
jgi:PAS domain S-box-containing protein